MRGSCAGRSRNGTLPGSHSERSSSSNEMMFRISCVVPHRNSQDVFRASLRLLHLRNLIAAGEGVSDLTTAPGTTWVLIDIMAILSWWEWDCTGAGIDDGIWDCILKAEFGLWRVISCVIGIAFTKEIEQVQNEYLQNKYPNPTPPPKRSRYYAMYEATKDTLDVATLRHNAKGMSWFRSTDWHSVETCWE